MNIIIIAAVGKNNELGKDNKLLWNLKEDLLFFKEKTLNQKVLMGRKTYESIGKILERRKYIIISHKNDFSEAIEVFNSVEEFLNTYKNLSENIYVIGGSSIYKEFLKYAKEIYLTEIDESFDADCFFPSFDKNEYEKEILSEHTEANLSYTHCLYKLK